MLGGQAHKTLSKKTPQNHIELTPTSPEKLSIRQHFSLSLNGRAHCCRKLAGYHPEKQNIFKISLKLLVVIFFLKNAA